MYGYHITTGPDIKVKAKKERKKEGVFDFEERKGKREEKEEKERDGNSKWTHRKRSFFIILLKSF